MKMYIILAYTNYNIQYTTIYTNNMLWKDSVLKQIQLYLIV